MHEETGVNSGNDYRQRIYDRYVSEYVAHTYELGPDTMAEHGRGFRWRLRGMLPEDRKARMVDIGCGSGAFLHYLRSLGYTDLLGVDASEEQLQVARAMQLPVRHGDAFEFLRNAEAGSFDFISAFDLIEHFRKEEVLEFLDLAHGALAPGGRILLQTPNAASLFGARLRYADFTHEVGLTPLSLTTALRVTGFDDVRIRGTGPVPHGIVSGLRYLAWSGIVGGLKLLQRIETGAPGEGVYTQVMIASAVRREEPA
jgi:2-polyprenyl-3-methyl-5-hydroxy-6-metoxy-1,4-benzoquinol methylase